MAAQPANWYRFLAIGSALAAVLGVVGMEVLQASALSQWLHIPLTALALGAMGVGAAVAGAAFMEYRQRSAGDREQTH